MSQAGHGQKERRAFFLEMEKECGFEIGLSCTRYLRKGLKEEYSTVSQGLTYDLDRAIKHGDVHDPTKTMRLYFTYDRETKQVVVGGGFEHRKVRLSL